MKSFPSLIAIAAIGGCVAYAAPATASPITNAARAGFATTQFGENSIQNVSGWHCRKKWSKRDGWHRHRRACDDYSYRYDDYSYGYDEPFAYGLGVPFFGFQFYDDDRRDRRHFKRKRHHKNW